jgi:hypothetical protein
MSAREPHIVVQVSQKKTGSLQHRYKGNCASQHKSTWALFTNKGSTRGCEHEATRNPRVGLMQCTWKLHPQQHQSIRAQCIRAAHQAL